MSNLHKKVITSNLPPFPPPSQRIPNLRQRAANRKDFSTKTWREYFDCDENIVVNENSFHIYKSGASGPLICYLHGGGFSGLSWALLNKCLSDELECSSIAIDMRGHGNTATQNDEDLSADTLARDVCNVLAILGNQRPVILVGHSMGGAIAVHAAKKNLIPTLAGLIVIDVVEGSAMDSLPAMHLVLANRPTMFQTLEKANQWCVKSGYIRNLTSARVSMVGQLVRQTLSDRHLPLTSESHLTAMDVINENEEAEESVTSSTQRQLNANNAATPGQQAYVWRIDLTKTEKFWRGWFTNLSASFLSIPVPKMLMLAGINNLDRELTIGQMQGKFQLQVLPKSGHAIHEDLPDKVAQAISAFLTRHRLARSKSDEPNPT